MGITSAAGKTILIVDPDVEVTRLLTFILEEERFEVTATQSIAEAVKLLSKSSFDLILTEAYEQRDPFAFDGTFLERLRSPAGQTPIILFSSYASPSIVSVGSFGLAAVLQKPLGIDDLVVKVKKVLSQLETVRKEHRGTSEP